MSKSPDKPPVICLMGPTASGKTAMAMELVQRIPAQIISVDSAQVYRGMDIGTGKPVPEELATAPHRLIDIRDPADIYSASDFREDALRHIAEIQQAGDLPLLVGGTMLYFKVLRDGLAAMPTADPRVRHEIEALAATDGWQSVHDELARVDPESAARIHPNDPQRLQRALEVYRVSGQPMTALHEQEKQASVADFPFDLHFFAIQPEQRAVLHEQIRKRFMQMIEAGLLQEVEALHARNDLHEGLPSIKAVGYRQVWDYLEGRVNYDEMLERSIIATRQLAKRQLTWLRSWANLHSLTDPSAESIDRVLKFAASVSI